MIRMNRVEVVLGRLEDDWRKTGITVKVWSQRKSHLKATNEIDPTNSDSPERLIQMVGAAGGACAEYLGKKYGDNIDPSDCARDAMRAFGEECRLQASLAVGAPAKVARLRGQEHRLKNNEQELLIRLNWLLDNHQKLTPKELDAVDSMISRLHASQL